jgi:transposase InsO family protein
MVHTDRGIQYASGVFRRLLGESGFVGSMSRKGNCWDNAVSESFFHSLKVEWLSGTRYRTREEARSDIFRYIEIEYNRKRLHSTLGYRAPEEVEAEYLANAS